MNQNRYSPAEKLQTSVGPISRDRAPSKRAGEVVVLSTQSFGVTYGAPGTGVTGTYKVRGTLAVSGDTFSGPFLTEIFALDGTLLFSTTGVVTGQRIGVEPL